MSDRVSITIEDGVADVRLNRPDKLNALDHAMFTTLVEAGDRLSADRSVRAVVLSGEGRGFSAGLDVATLGAIATIGDDDRSGDGQAGAAGSSREAGMSSLGARDADASPTWLSRRCTRGPSCQCPSSPPCTGWRSAGASRSPSAPTCGSSPPTPGCRCWRSAGGSCRT